jgi:hypothetical protein
MLFLIPYSLSDSYEDGISRSEKDKALKCLRILAEKGKLTHPLDKQSDAWLKSKLSEKAYEALIYANMIDNAYKQPIDISGKILDFDGNLFKEDVTLIADVNFLNYEKKVTNGKFEWKDLPDSTGFEIIAKKDGYYEDRNGLSIYDSNINGELKADDILLYMIPKGDPVDLEWTNFANIVPLDGEVVGWSFKRRWYYPADQYDVLMKCYTDNKDELTLEMKEGGGFIPAEKYAYRESELDNSWSSFKRMIKAPEIGYVQKITLNKRLPKFGGKYYYFRTPDGKYGKMKIEGFYDGECEFSYYLNPTGSRNLELKDKINKHPKNPKELYPFPEE